MKWIIFRHMSVRFLWLSVSTCTNTVVSAVHWLRTNFNITFCKDIFPHHQKCWNMSGLVQPLPPQTRAHICHEYHKLYSWRKHCHVEKFGFSIKNLNNLWSFIKVYAVFVPNLCWEKSMWWKNDKYEVQPLWWHV